MALPPYYNSAVASGHAPHPYMWGPPQVPLDESCIFCLQFRSATIFVLFVHAEELIKLIEDEYKHFTYYLFQPMMPPYGAPYAAVYSHGGVYSHPAVPIVSLHFVYNLVRVGVPIDDSTSLTCFAL